MSYLIREMPRTFGRTRCWIASSCIRRPFGRSYMNEILTTTEIATDCFRNHRSSVDFSRSFSMQCDRRIALLWLLVEQRLTMMARERYSSKRKIRINALAHKVGKRMFIATALIAITILVVLFLKPEVFEIDDAPHHFGDAEKVLPRNADTPP
jgi:hypothetical protein